MPKFLSLDGVDKNGIRAEVTVQTGTGRITEIVGRGKQNEDGSFRNMEIVFDPDNPLLKRKVYGLLDTTATDLWKYIQEAHADGRTVSYRIESQRRNGVERGTPIGELNPTEQIRRILASIDGVFSHEAKTNPAEDPSNENPSALTQNLAAVAPAVAGPTPDATIAAVRAAVAAGLPRGVVDALVAQALLAGVPADSLNEAWGVGPRSDAADLNSEGVAQAAKAEQFALDHLIHLYTPVKSKDPVSVSDEMLAQSASVGLTLLGLADDVQVGSTHMMHPDRHAPSFARSLDLVIDAVAKRYPVPVGGNEQAQAEWRDAVIAEASERLYGLGRIAAGLLPLSEDERAGKPAPTAPTAPPVAVPESTPPAPQTHDDEAAVLEEFSLLKSASDIVPFVAPKMPLADAPDFTMPSAELIGRLRTLCESANVTSDTAAISDWIERRTGVRSARKVHAPVLDDFCSFYESAGPERVRLEVMQRI